jgi:hypothetical protein
LNSYCNKATKCNQKVHILNWRHTHTAFGIAILYLGKNWTEYNGLRVSTNSMGSRGSSISIVTRLQTGRIGFHYRQGLGFLLFSIASRPVLRSIQPPTQRVPGGGLSQGGKVAWAWSWPLTSI